MRKPLARLGKSGNFELQGRTITVTVAPLDDQDAYGLWQPSLDRITLDKDATPDMRVHAALHEFCHAAFEVCGRHDLSRNERFVDMFSGLLHQFLKSRL